MQRETEIFYIHWTINLPASISYFLWLFLASCSSRLKSIFIWGFSFYIYRNTCKGFSFAFLCLFYRKKFIEIRNCCPRFVAMQDESHIGNATTRTMGENQEKHLLRLWEKMDLDLVGITLNGNWYGIRCVYCLRWSIKFVNWIELWRILFARASCKAKDRNSAGIGCKVVIVCEF